MSVQARARLGLALVLATLLGASPAWAEEASPSDAAPPPADSASAPGRGPFPLRAIGHVLGSPAHWRKRGWMTFGAASFGVAAVALLDAHVRDETQEGHTPQADRMTRTIEPLGAEYSFGVLGAFYLSGLAFKSPRAKAIALDGITASLIASGIITPTLKVISGRARPSQESGVHHFHPFGSDRSFPSGHTTQAFAVASVIAARHDALLVKATAYGLAAMVGYARLYHDAHFASDVLAGALIGTAVGESVVRFDQAGRRHLSVSPLLSDTERGMMLSLSLAPRQRSSAGAPFP